MTGLRRLLETGERGAANPNDATRELDVLDVQTQIEPLGSDIQRYRVENIPNYIDLLEHVFKTIGWDPSQIRGYRTRIEYPIFGSQIQHIFELPLRKT